MKLKQKKKLSVFLGICLMYSMVACVPEAETVVEEKQQLVLWHYWDLPYTRETLGNLVEGYNEEHPDVEIYLRYIPDEDFKKQLSLAIADGIMPDIVLIDSADVQFFNETGYLVDVTDIIEKEAYLDVAIASCISKDGSLSGIPVGVNCLAFFYNERLLREAELPVPKSLDEFVDAATKLSKDDVYGCAFPSLQSEETLFCFLPILWGQGGTIATINSDAGKRAFDFLQQLSENGAMSPRTVNMTLGDVAREFKKEKIAMMFTTTMSAKSMELDKAQLPFRMGTLPIAPTPISVVGGEVLAATKGENQEEAKAFLQYMAEEERIKEYIDGFGYISPRKDILEWQLEVYPYIEQQVAILNTARTREFTPYWPKISLAMADAINAVVLGADISVAVEVLEETMKQIRGGKE